MIEYQAPFRKRDLIYLAFLLALSAGVFLWDLSVPLGVAAGVPYVAVVLLGFRLPWRRSIAFLAALSSILVLLGYWFSPLGGIAWIVIANRILALFAIWVAAVLMMQRRKFERELKATRDNLETLIEMRTAELQLSEQRMRDYSEAVSDWFWESDTDHRLSLVSEGDLSDAGLKSELILGKARWELVGADLNEPRWLRHISDLRLRKPFRDFRYEVTNEHGKGVWLSVSGQPVYDGNGDFTGYRGTTADITEHMEIEARSQQQLKMEALGTLAGGVAHDLNNTLVPIIGLTELVMDDLPETGQPHSNLEQVLQAAAHARELVAQILTFSRQESQTFHKVNLAKVIRDAMILVRASIPTTIRINEHINEVGLVNVDSTQIGQVIMNLVTNAVHAMKEKGTLTIRLNLVEVDDAMIESHRELEPGAYAKISIEDDGPGINQSDAARIFDPFYTTKGVGEGTGLGLSVVYGIVSNHKGTIEASSTSETGAVFSVYLPLAPEN